MLKQFTLSFAVALMFASTVAAEVPGPVINAGPVIDAGSFIDLETARKTALEANQSLAAAQARVEQAKARVEQARAAYWPTLDGGGSWSRVDAADASVMPGRKDPETYYRTSITATFDLFDGFARKFSAAAARYGRDESEAARLDARRMLLAQVSAAYFNAQKAREAVEVAMADAEFNARQLMEAKARRAAGTGSLSDEMNFEIRVNSAKAGVIQAGQSLEVAMAGLAGLLGLPEGTFGENAALAPLDSDNSEKILLGLELNDEALVESALEKRPDLNRSALAVEAAGSNAGVARSALFPTIKLMGAFEGSRVDDPYFKSDDMGNSVLLSIGFRFFDGGARKAKIIEANARKTEAERLNRQAMISAASEVRQAIAVFKAAKKQLKLELANMDLVSLTRDLVEKEYSAGQASLVRLNEVQRDFVQARGRLLTARINLRLAKVNLDAAAGEI